MSSAEVPHSNRLSCSFCLEGASPIHEEEIRRLDELLSDVEKLKCEKADLLKQNVSCKTDIKKLKQRLECNYFIHRLEPEIGDLWGKKRWMETSSRKPCL